MLIAGVFVIGVNGIGAAPAVFFGADTGWITRPWFYPPEIAFPVVWTLLFTLMGISLFIIWRNGGDARLQRQAYGAFALQFAFNLAWTPVFFGLQRPDLGLLVIIGLWIAITLTIYAFNRVNRVAAWLLVPYLAWVSFAAVLNYAIFTAG